MSFCMVLVSDDLEDFFFFFFIEILNAGNSYEFERWSREGHAQEESCLI